MKKPLAKEVKCIIINNNNNNNYYYYYYYYYIIVLLFFAFIFFWVRSYFLLIIRAKCKTVRDSQGKKTWLLLLVQRTVRTRQRNSGEVSDWKTVPKRAKSWFYPRLTQDHRWILSCQCQRSRSSGCQVGRWAVFQLSAHSLNARHVALAGALFRYTFC